MSLLPIRSTIPGLRWPGLPGQSGARLLALQYQFAQSEWWPEATMSAHQFRQLESMVAHCTQHMPFWRDRLRTAGIRPGQKLDANTWRRLPILTREIAQAANDRLICSFIPEGHGGVSEGGTTGSTGRPLLFAMTEMANVYRTAINLRNGIWHQTDPREKLAVVRLSVDDGDRYDLPDWGPGWNDVCHTGPMVGLDVGLPVPEQAAWLMAENPTYLRTRTSSLTSLARHFRDTGLTLPRLRSIRTLGEVVTPDLRQLVRDVFGVGIMDVYSSQEVGFIALQCPAHEHHHVVSETVRVEVVDDDDRPCEPGQTGRVLVSTLHNAAMPLLRYWTGDYAELGPPCSCGRGLPVLTRIVGRVRDRVIRPDGTYSFAYYGEGHIHEIDAILQHQLVQVSRERMEFHLVVRRPLTEEEQARMTGWVRDGLRHPFEVGFVYVDDIPRGPGGKFQSFRSGIEQP